MADASSTSTTSVEMCQIRRWRGYVKSTFYAVTDAGEVIAESSAFRWRKAEPPPETPQARAAHDQVVDALEQQGWKRAAPASTTWFDETFLRPLTGPISATATHGHRAPQPWPRGVPTEPEHRHGPAPPSALEHGHEGSAEP